jgi:hypothetical protein
MSSHGTLILINVVGRNGGLREIVEQVVHHHLNRDYRQKWQHNADFDIFGDVAEHIAIAPSPRRGSNCCPSFELN